MKDPFSTVRRDRSAPRQDDAPDDRPGASFGAETSARGSAGRPAADAALSEDDAGLLAAHAGVIEAADPPAPSAMLEALVATTEPVAVRRPWSDLATIAALAAGWTILHVVVYGERTGTSGGPPRSAVVVAAAYTAVYVLAWSALLVPPEGRVSIRRRRVLGAVAMLGFSLIAGTVAVVSAMAGPPAPLESSSSVSGALSCGLRGFEIALAPSLVGWSLIRRVAGAGTPWAGAAFGAAQGILASMILHLECHRGGALHVVFGHAAFVLIFALVGAVLLPRSRSSLEGPATRAR